jgi:hypothetical protein
MPSAARTLISIATAASWLPRSVSGNGVVSGHAGDRVVERRRIRDRARRRIGERAFEHVCLRSARDQRVVRRLIVGDDVRIAPTITTIRDRRRDSSSRDLDAERIAATRPPRPRPTASTAYWLTIAPRWKRLSPESVRSSESSRRWRSTEDRDAPAPTVRAAVVRARGLPLDWSDRRARKAAPASAQLPS